jgi:hypothetical protein
MNNWYELTCPSCKTRHFSPTKEDMEEVICGECYFPMAGVADMDLEEYVRNDKLLAHYADLWKEAEGLGKMPHEKILAKFWECLDKKWQADGVI